VPETVTVRRPNDPETLLRAYHEDGDVRARDTAIELFAPLARRLARRYATPTGEPVEDLEQVAFLGLVKAVDRYDPARGFAFSTFATPTILGELRRYFRDATWRVHVPRGLQEQIQSVEKAITDVQERLGRAPSPVEVAEHSGLAEEVVLEALAALHRTKVGSLDRPADDDTDDGGTVGDRLASTEQGYELVEYGASAAPALARLSERDRLIVHLRFTEDLLQSEIAQRVGLSQMQVSRILARSVRLLREAAGEPA